MFTEIPQDPVLVATGAFLLGCILASVLAALRYRSGVKQRDPRDDRIRELDAELRIANSDREKLKENVGRLETELKSGLESAEVRDNVITEQQSKIDRLTNDLKGSVIKTRELRSELTDRAAENVQAEVKLREVETELSVAHASTDMITTGILDYAAEFDGADESQEPGQTAEANPQAKKTVS